MPTPSPIRHGTTSCRLPILPQENFSTLTRTTRVVHQCPSAGSLGRRDYARMATEGFAFLVCSVLNVCKINNN